MVLGYVILRINSGLEEQTEGSVEIRNSLRVLSHTVVKHRYISIKVFFYTNWRSRVVPFCGDVMVGDMQIYVGVKSAD